MRDCTAAHSFCFTDTHRQERWNSTMECASTRGPVRCQTYHKFSSHFSSQQFDHLGPVFPRWAEKN